LLDCDFSVGKVQALSENAAQGVFELLFLQEGKATQGCDPSLRSGHVFCPGNGGEAINSYQSFQKYIRQTTGYLFA
jgi:hypothetical protein